MQPPSVQLRFSDRGSKCCADFVCGGTSTTGSGVNACRSRRRVRCGPRRQKPLPALTAMTMAATAVVPLQAAAAPAAKPTTEKTEAPLTAAQISPVRGVTAAVATTPLRRAMFGAVAGTIAAIAVAQQRREAQRDYYRAQYGYGALLPGYYGCYGPDYNYRGPGVDRPARLWWRSVLLRRQTAPISTPRPGDAGYMKSNAGPGPRPGPFAFRRVYYAAPLRLPR